MSSDGEILGFQKPDGTMASVEEYQADAIQYARNFAVDARMCHIHNHSHDCKATCFKYNQMKPAQRTEQDGGRAAAPQRQSCRFRFWRVIEVGRTFLRRLGKAFVATPLWLIMTMTTMSTVGVLSDGTIVSEVPPTI